MRQYLLSIYQPDGPIPPPEVLEPIMRDLAALNAELRAAGAWVFSTALHPPETATVLRPGGAPGSGSGDEVSMTDGPFVEGKEHLGGFTAIRAADLDEALEWGRRLSRASTLPVEVRPMRDDPAR
ncbi:YciI family protein [Plantactinospora siamensis]|uniref:YciI family protein n=1 Tax=Plantactinospora siamensis TaxID=555372 RepID=A0ABV6NW19_9ACTN